MSHIDQFLSSIVVLDTETTNLIPEQAEIVEIAEAHWLDNSWSTQGMLLGAKRGIPAAASAKNNISNRMIAGKPTFGESQEEIRQMLRWPDAQWYVAHNANYDRQVLAVGFQSCGSEEDLQTVAHDGRWLCTWRLSRHILSHDFDDMEYSLNYLRYKLDLPVPDGLRLHRASDDTYLCAVLFEYLVKLALQKGMVHDGPALGHQLNQLCWSPIIQTTWPYGKHKGKLLTEIPDDYYAWAFKNMNSFNEDSEDYDRDLSASVVQVLNARLLGLDSVPKA